MNKIKSQDLTTRSLLLALGYSIVWISIHWLYVKPSFGWYWIFPQLLASVLIYTCLNALFATLDFYKWGKFLQPVVTLLYFQPIFQISYFQAYKTFLEQQNLSLLLREPMFILNVFAKEVTALQAGLFVLGIVILHSINAYFLNHLKTRNSKAKPYLLFESKWIWLFLVFAVGSQIRWCLNHDPSQLIMRPLYPIVIIAVISVLMFFYKVEKQIWKKAFWVLALFLNIGQLYALNLGFPEFRDKMSLDSRFYRALFGAYFVNTAMSTLDQTDQAQEKFIRLPKAELNYNILVILDDSQRWDFSERHGYPKETDRQLNWFYDRAYDFQYPVAPANFTDTSVPAILTGLGSNRDVLEIKGGLTLWDYFAKGAETFFISSQKLDWSRLNLFYQSIGQKHLWGALINSEYKGNQEQVDDRYLVQEFKKYSQERKLKNEHWVGVLQTFSSHYPYNHFPSAPQPHQPCDLTRETGVEPFANCYANGQISAAWAKSEILKSIDLENTIVILTSDHGEGFNEHGIWFHGVDYHQEMIKVPFFVYIPNQIKSKIPKELLENLQANTKNVTSAMDLVPTLLDIHQITTGQQLAENPEIFSGKSLLRKWDQRLVFSSHCFPQYRCYSREIAFVDNDYFVLFRPSEGFYKIYNTFSDLKQTSPIDPKSIPRQKLEQIVDQAALTHSIGQSMKSYFHTWK